MLPYHFVPNLSPSVWGGLGCKNFLFGRRPAPKGRWPPLSPLHI